MTGFLIRRLFQMAIVIFLSALACYVLLNFAPGGPLAGLRQRQQSTTFRITEEDMARIRAYYELDLNVFIRFTRWFAGIPRGPLVIGKYEFFGNYAIGCAKPVVEAVMDKNGNFNNKEIGCKQLVYLRDLTTRRFTRGVLFFDFGNSWRLNRDRPVMDLIASRIPNSILLIGLETIFALLIGLPLGIYSAIKQYSKFDYFFTTLAFMGSAMPTFFFGILLILFLSILPKSAGLPYLPPGSMYSVRDYTIPWFGTVDARSALDKVLHLILPVATLTFVSVAGWSRYVRGSMLEVLRQDYVRTARAKGLSERVVIVKHTLRNALIPFITIVVFAIPNLFGGAIITETIFSWPGMGRIYFQALGDKDYPAAMAILYITAFLIVIATLIRDVLYMWVDPRVRVN
jgi:peptide/nickel transport system permease protein